MDEEGDPYYPLCATCGDYVMACTCYEEWEWRKKMAESEREKLIDKLSDTMDPDNARAFVERVIQAHTGMRFGIYRKLHGRTGVGMLYQFVNIARHHTTGQEFVTYMPLRIEPEWAGTVRNCVWERELFEANFEFVSEGLPKT